MSDRSSYDMLADTIEIRDITSDEENADILCRLKDNNPSFTRLQLNAYTGGSQDYYCPEALHDMEWLGYYVGKNTNLEVLCFGNADNSIDSKESFCRGLKNNKFIWRLAFYDSDLSEIDIFQFTEPFIKNNPSLIRFEVSDCELGGRACHTLSRALQGRTIRSLEHFTLNECEIDDEHLGEVISSLSTHPRIEALRLNGNGMGRIGITALATILLRTATELRKVDLSNNNIDDVGIEYLTFAIARHGTLQRLNLSNNSSITIRGWRAISTLLEAPRSNLQQLYLQNNEIDDEGAVLFASALTDNCTVRTLDLNGNHSITNKGWAAFSKLVCDTSSVNTTYLSNHTLENVSGHFTDLHHRVPRDLVSFLDLNMERSKKHAATIKILEQHNDFDMLPLLEWDLKLMPCVVKWMGATSGCPTDFDKSIGRRKLSALYQFIRAMPMANIEARASCSCM